MQINLQGKNIELTKAIEDYVLERVTNLGKLLYKIETSGQEITGNFEVAKSSNHHKAGDIFHADCLIKIDGKEFFASAEKESLYQAVDEVKEHLFAEINKSKKRQYTLFKRGAASVKKMMKGLSKRNPFSAKYDNKHDKK